MSDSPTYSEAMKFWLKLGFISFGGPAGQIAIMHEFLVVKKKWISESRYLHALNYCMLLPGPEAQQLATYLGWLLHGTRGAVTAGGLFILPSVIFMLGLSIVYVTLGKIPWIYSMFNGLKPAVIAIVILALIKIAGRSLKSPLHYIIASAAFAGLFSFNVPFPLIIVGAIIAATIITFLFPQKYSGKSEEQLSDSFHESEYVINSGTKIEHTGFSFVRLIKQIITFAVLWFLPLALFSMFAIDFSFWKNLTFFFTKAAFVTFGGAYAVLPYVAQVSVEQFRWLTELQMIDGLALGETTPGPLIMVLTFVGFMGAYGHFESSLLMASIGLLTTTFYTFLPSFLFILAGAPIIERTHESPKIKNVLGFVTAAVVGVILNLTIYLGKAVVFPDGVTLSGINIPAVVWIVISVFALQKFKVNMFLWVIVSAIFGIIFGLIA
jgi:chromate transporter